jgi:hypothetical protein
MFYKVIEVNVFCVYPLLLKQELTSSDRLRPTPLKILT